jgi:hypothetical protein
LLRYLVNRGNAARQRVGSDAASDDSPSRHGQRWASLSHPGPVESGRSLPLSKCHPTMAGVAYPFLIIGLSLLRTRPRP